MKDIDKAKEICCEVESGSVGSYHPMAPEIVQTSSFQFESYEQFIEISHDEKSNYVYTRGSNPTTAILENKLATLEGAEQCKVFASGMGAIAATLFTLVKANDHVLLINTVYGEAVALIRYLEKFNIEYTRIDVEDTAEIKNYIKSNTSVIYFESPSSQTFRLLDLAYIAQIAQEKEIYTVIDNTWSSPIFQHPLKYGIDLVIHSLSKYVSGHSDVVSGAVIGKKALVDNIFEHGHQMLGATNSPFDSWLSIRGLRTLPVRMEAHERSVKQVLDYLQSDPRIEQVFHPYCGNLLQKNLANQYLTGYGSVFGIDVVDTDFTRLKCFVDSLKVFILGVSWGGFESLVLPAFKGNNQAALLERGLSQGHIRMYVGLEDGKILISDLKQALDKAYGPAK